MGVEEKYELRQGTMFSLNRVRHAFLHFELMIEQHFPPQKDDIIEIAITSFTQKTRLQEGKKKSHKSLIYPGMYGCNRKVFIFSYFEMWLLSTLIKQGLKIAFRNSVSIFDLLGGVVVRSSVHHFQ